MQALKADEAPQQQEVADDELDMISWDSSESNDHTSARVECLGLISDLVASAVVPLHGLTVAPGGARLRCQ